MINLPFETFNRNSYEAEMKRALRITRGWSPFQLTVEISDEQARFLADFAGLSADDRTDERQLAKAMKELLDQVIELRNEHDDKQ